MTRAKKSAAKKAEEHSTGKETGLVPKKKKRENPTVEFIGDDGTPVVADIGLSKFDEDGKPTFKSAQAWGNYRLAVHQWNNQQAAKKRGR